MAKHNDLGKMGEMVAARHLMFHGYNILALDWHYGHKDLDIVAEKDGLTIFVEVKTRSTKRYGNPEEAVDNDKMHNLISSAQAYMRRYGINGPVRFDVIAVTGTGEPFEIDHFEDAFNSYSLTLLQGGGSYSKY